MIKVENIDVWGFEHGIRGMRNPLNSHDKSDSGHGCKDGTCMMCGYFNACTRKEKYNTQSYHIGENDLSLMRKLYKAGVEHRTYARMIMVSMDITAPLYYWKEADRYSIGKIQVSTSTMHTIHKKPFELDDFSHEHLISEYNHANYYEPDYDESIAEKRIIDGYEDYSISENGIVYSRKNGYEHILVQRIDIDGYKTVGLYNNGKCKRIKVHRLVANAFLNKIDNKDCINHIDGNKWNNKKENLEWCTRSENSKHAYAMGLANYGSKQRLGTRKKCRYTPEQIQEIKSLYYGGMSQRKIGELFQCDHSVISEIINNKIYKEIQIAPYEVMELIIDELNSLRDAYIETKDEKYWHSMIQLLPSSYNQKRTICMSYEVVFKIIKERSNHKLDEWVEFCKILRQLPYVEEIMEED